MSTPSTFDFVIVGAGIFGTATALALHDRGHRVALVEAGPVPHPLASSTDINKIVRLEYGDDALYCALAQQAYAGWHVWNERFARPLFHEVGIVYLTANPFQDDMQEQQSYQYLLDNGYHPQRLSQAEIPQRFPAFAPDVFTDGFFHAKGGYAASGYTVQTLAAYLRAAGVTVLAHTPVQALQRSGNRVTGILTQGGETLSAGQVIVAAGAWTITLLPNLQTVLQPTAQSLFHLIPPQPDLFRAGTLPVFAADVFRTGWYGFPLHPDQGVVKIARHDIPGPVADPTTAPHTVSEAQQRDFQDFADRTFPTLAGVPPVYQRVCLYTMTPDEDFLIDRHPSLEGLVIATGGSGHGFKFGPALGEIVADVVEGRDNPFASRFAWREATP